MAVNPDESEFDRLWRAQKRRDCWGWVWTVLFGVAVLALSFLVGW